MQVCRLKLNSAHGPLGEEPEKFKALMREKFLTIAKETDV